MRRSDIPDDMLGGLPSVWRELMVEAAAEATDELMEKYLETR